ncbi:MAG: response regulator, partial [Myxococcales bacterium]
MSPRSGEQTVMSQGVALVADDNGVVRYMVSQQVARLGLKVVTVNNGLEALARLSEQVFDVLLLDVMMPEMDGLGVLAEIRKHSEWREMPVIMISGVEEVKTAARCIEAGAEDYLTKPIDTILLEARLKASLERRRLREVERRYYRAMLESQQALRSEMEAAAGYVRSLLPAPIRSGPVEIDWRFIPSEQMGGDAFGYHQVTPDHLAVYLLDVCGHGFGATLLATSVINVLRSQTLVGADFTSPPTVLAALNDAFLMERQGGNYFTLWYGVYHLPTRTLHYASSA